MGQMLLHYCQLIILDVLREQLFVKETQLLPRNLFCLSFSWLQGSKKPKVAGHLQSPFLGSSVAKEGAQDWKDLAWSPVTPLPQG